ncbi:DNA polymerase I [Helicobacter sp. MIT 14-3879]|uniref:DNA polymerase I n=1 Tax=Helicobacter sp. MIT 14-3879 TaxID=2040649 RepID=UPI000E1F83BC|nr:DNA polymerase I [Helicobacter sp. MIT 14-3879]RDU61736.1 DNA polymerase I [Helicobacter sp. MIT 14-3879]
MQKPVILVDTFGYFFRSYYALPPLQNSKQFPTSLLTGFSHFIFNLYKDNPQTCIIFALEGGGTNKRKEIYPQYKANRQKAPEDLLLQLPVALTWLEKMQVPQVMFDGYEADDCIASLSSLANAMNLEVQIISHDKDLYQLINEKTSLFDYARKQKITAKECQEKFGVTPKEFITYQSIVGDSSDNIPGIKGIGMKGAQQILAHFKDLNVLYATLESHEEKLIGLFGKRITGLIKEHKDTAFLSQNLVTLKKDLFPKYDFLSSQNHNNPMPLLKIQQELAEYELYKIIGNLKKYQPTFSTQQKNLVSAEAKNTSDNSIILDYTQQGEQSTGSPITKQTFRFNYQAITEAKQLFTLLESIPKGTTIAFDCETDGLNVKENVMVGFSFCFDGLQGYYVPFLHGINVQEDSVLPSTLLTSNEYKRLESQEDFPLISQNSTQGSIKYHTVSESLFDSLRESSSKEDCKLHQSPLKQISKKDAKRALEIIFSYPLIGHNLKFDISMAWHNFGILPKECIMDSMILAWLLDSNQSLSLDNLMWQYFGHKMIAFSDVVAKNHTFDSVDIEKASEYASEDAVATYQLYKHLELLTPPDILKIAKELEFPFILTLCYMEDSGIRINREYFLDLKQDFTRKLHVLQQQIYQESGYEFNINSPKQLAQVLFEYLKLDSKQTKRNKPLSTNEVTLHNLIDKHPVIALLLEYREVFKLFSTYIEPLLKLTQTHKRIYTSFIQTGTNTGRLSSKSPNLQNIPVRSELGKSIRMGFEAESGNVLVSLDYSQIELRLLAHFSQDSVLIESFKNNADIHAEAARRIFGSVFENADSATMVNLRNIAKSINFGLIYGMGARKLAQTLRISNGEAKTYIESYFASFPTVKQYLEQKKEEILQQGYSQTLLGRKRHFDFLNATEFMRQNFLREGINAIFQGSAADLMKLSMNAIFDNIADFRKSYVSNVDLQDSKHAKMLLQVHDELIFEIEESKAQRLANNIKEIMENIYCLDVPLICNVACGKSWASLK